jgi:hypothetical protein
MYTYLQQSKYACLDACYPAHEALNLIFQLSTKGSDSCYNGITIENLQKLWNIVRNLFFTLNMLKDVPHIFIFLKHKFLLGILIIFSPEDLVQVKIQDRIKLAQEKEQKEPHGTYFGL